MSTPTHPLSYRVLSLLLDYPEQPLIDALPELDSALADVEPALCAQLAPLFAHLGGEPSLIALQETYVGTFDRQPAHSLHLFEHLHGEDRARGQAMVDLIEEYRAHGFEPVSHELPDYLPLFLEFLSLCAADEARRLLDDAVHVVAHIGRQLASRGSPYACVLHALATLASVEPQPLSVPPVRDMDEALETFGPGPDGVEPLLKPALPELAPIHFHPSRPHA
jgi:nitrate reductase delta subunit